MKETPLLDHEHDAEAAFTPEALMESVVGLRRLPHREVPDVCVLEFDGDLHDELVASGDATRWPTWACFHTSMASFDVDGRPVGIVARTIGGPYATLVAEQLFASGASVVLGLTSAGRVGGRHGLPHLVVVDRAIRDEGTSLHYLPATRLVDAHVALADDLEGSLGGVGLPVHRGTSWTTDAPYRETRPMLARRAAEGALCVEMQAASLFALAAARQRAVGVVAHVTNAVDAEGEAFHKGPADIERRVLLAACRGARRFLARVA